MTVLVNYLWMKRGAGSAAIPAHLIQRLQQNAQRYPEQVFYLWVESADACKQQDLPPNVQIRSLAPLVGRVANPIMTSSRQSDFWSKVDIARLLAVQDCLSQPGCTAAVYADFDIPDIKLDSPGLRRRLEQFGAAFGASYCARAGREFIVSYFDNGYMAFTPKASQLLNALIMDVSSPTFLANTRVGRVGMRATTSL